jgi:hypothetical protein
MTGRSLPERPDLAGLQAQVGTLHQAVHAGEPDALDLAGLAAADPGYPVHRAQLALAQMYGFASWARLRAHVAEIEARTWTPPEVPDDAPPAHRLLRLACLTWSGPVPDPDAALALLARHPDLPGTSAALAAVCARPDRLAQLLAADPAAATRPQEPYGWSPLMYLTYARLPGQAAADVVACAEALLDAGADPDDGRYVDGWPTAFTVLTGVIGGGEQAEPPHPHLAALARLLLRRGTDPNDAQALYNRMFTSGDDWLELLLEHGLGQGDGGPWRHRLPDLTASPPEQLRSLLAWAVTHDQRDRVALLARAGVDVQAPLSQPGLLSTPATPLKVALLHGHRELAALLRGLGATEPDLDPVEAFVAAVLAQDEVAVGATAPAVVAAAREARPGLVVWAAAQHRPRAVELLVAAGWDVDALARSDVPVEQPWQTALHTAVEKDDADLVRRLLALGADREIRDARFDGRPVDWAGYLDRPALVPILAG